MSIVDISKVQTRLEKQALKRKAIIEKGKVISGTLKGDQHEPIIEPLAYEISLMKALNYYNVAYEDSEKKTWVLNYVDKDSVRILSKFPDWDFHTLGSLIRLKLREQFLNDKELHFIENTLSKMKSIFPSKPETEKVLVNKQSKQNEAVTKFIAEIDGLLDELTISGYKNVSAFIERMTSHVKGPTSSPTALREAIRTFSLVLEELKIVLDGTDPDLKEGYSHLRKVQLNNYIKAVEAIISVCAQSKVSKPKIVREKKAVPLSKQVEKLLYKKEDVNLGLRSELSSKIIGASAVLTYNTVKRQLSYYVADKGSTLGVKGMGLIGFSIENSKKKTIRKPETISPLVKLLKRDFEKAFEEIKAAAQNVSVRFDENTLILKTYK